jgi:hypothetical protein
MPASEWVEIVAPTHGLEAERQFTKWEQRNPIQRALLGAKDIRAYTAVPHSEPPHSWQAGPCWRRCIGFR